MAGALNTEDYEKALISLRDVLERPLDPDFIVRDASIQRFEYCMELTWKLLKRYIKIVYSTEEFATREIFRKAERFGVIADSGIWIKYLDQRNLTSHTYNEKTAQSVYETAKFFYKDATDLLESVKDGYARHNAG